MDLSGWRRKDLRELCEFHGLEASGSTKELERRIQEAFCEGAALDVYCPVLQGHRTGYISGFLEDGSGFEVTYMDKKKRVPKTRVVLLTDDDFQLLRADEEEPDGEGATDESSGGWETDDGEADSEGDEEEAVPLEEWSKEELRAALRERGLPGSGTKAELVERLEEAFAEEEGDDGDEADSDGEWATDEDGEDAVPLEEWLKEDLRAALRQRGLSGNGTKAELVERLEKAFAEEQGDEEYADSDGAEGITAGMGRLHTWDSPSSAAAGGGGGGAARKRALIIGASCKGQEGYLPGVLPDTRAMHRLLVEHFGFPDSPDCIKVLTDDQKDRFRRPTRHNIRRGCEWLTKDVRRGDSLFFHFSGHGDSEEDPSEPRKYAQSICPCDHGEAGVITDKELHTWLVKPLPAGVTLHALIDSCHSGTVMNLPYNAVLEEGRWTGWEDEYPGEAWKHATAAGALAVQFSAARHDQTAADLGSQGAATYAFQQAIQKHWEEWGFNIEYGELLQAMYEELQGSDVFEGQEPTMSASSQFNPLSSATKFEL